MKKVKSKADRLLEALEALRVLNETGLVKGVSAACC